MADPKKPTHRRRKHARPAEIRRAALEELAENGIAGSTLAGTAKRAGISRTTVYLYFDTKQDTFEAVARDSVGQTIEEATALLDELDGTIEELFTVVIDQVYTKVVQGDAHVILRALVAEGQSNSEIVAFYHREIPSKGETLIRRLIDWGIARGALAPEAAVIDPRVIVAPALFAGIWRLVFESHAPLDLEAFKRDHVALALEGLLAR